MKKILEKFLGPLYFCLSRVLPLEGIKPLNCTLTIKYTFIRYVPVREKELQPNEGAPGPPAHPGNNGKQGGERFRTILKYPTATDMAMKRNRDNDTSLRRRRRTRRG